MRAPLIASSLYLVVACSPVRPAPQPAKPAPKPPAGQPLVEETTPAPAPSSKEPESPAPAEGAAAEKSKSPDKSASQSPAKPPESTSEPAGDAVRPNLLDSSKRCQQPEDVDQHEDHDGCPDIDNDRDGRPDAIDRCPDDRENNC